jgi:uridylate kinase
VSGRGIAAPFDETDRAAVKLAADTSTNAVVFMGGDSFFDVQCSKFQRAFFPQSGEQ